MSCSSESGGCRLGLGETCHGRQWPRGCELLAAGRTEYEPLMRRKSGPHVEPVAPADREVAELLARLTEAQKDEIATCPQRRDVMGDGCCPLTVCSLGYFGGGRIDTTHCARCRLEGRAVH